MVKRLEERDEAMKTTFTKRLEDIQTALRQTTTPGAVSDPSMLANMLRQFASESTGISKDQFLLASFKFDAMRAREIAINENHAKTFQWLYESGPGAATGFVDWLSGDGDLFWITGKAGSGKSTLMKYLFENPQTHTELQRWAGDRKLIVSRHFFWNPGTSMQKSYQGLLQAVCYDIFHACPDLLRIVCQKKWSSLDSRACIEPDVFRNETWTQTELSNIIEELARSNIQSDGRRLRLCFFIDGLDEYHGQHDYLIKALCTLANLNNLKICVSSRPWNIFEDAFGGLSESRRMLVLQDLTRNDIGLYVRERLEADHNFHSMQRYDSRCSELINEITSKADGVFLWVFLVVNELLQSLTNADDFSTLQRRLRRIPPGLEAYFQHMFDALDDFYQLETAQMFRIMVEAPFYIPLLAFSVLHPGDPLASRVVKDLHTVVTRDEQSAIEGRMSKRIRGRCRDLLEVSNQKVHFLHRTVRDFLSTDDMTGLLDSRTGPDFRLNRVVCWISLIGLRYLNTTVSSTAYAEDSGTFQWLLPSFFYHVRKVEDEEDRAASDLHDAYVVVTSDLTDAFINELPSRASLLALMNIPHELRRYLDSERRDHDKQYMTELLFSALVYLSKTVEATATGTFYFTTEQYLLTTLEMDPERRGFRPAIVRFLLRQGAQPNRQISNGMSVWEHFLSEISCTATTSDFRRRTCFAVSVDLIRAGARMNEELEQRYLVSAFGQSDAQWLYDLRGETNRSSWSWWPWKKRVGIQSPTQDRNLDIGFG